MMEAEERHIKEKAAANSTIFLVRRLHSVANVAREPFVLEDVEPLVVYSGCVRNVQRFREAGIGGSILTLCRSGPALEEFSKHWPLKRAARRADKPAELKRKRQSDVRRGV